MSFESPDEGIHIRAAQAGHAEMLFGRILAENASAAIDVSAKLTGIDGSHCAGGGYVL